MKKEERDNDALSSSKEKEDTDQHFEKSKKNEKRRKRHEVNRTLEQSCNESACRRESDDFQESEPKKDNKESESRKRHRDPAKKMDEARISLGNVHVYSISDTFNN